MTMIIGIIMVTLTFVCMGFTIGHWLKLVSLNREIAGLVRRLNNLPGGRATVAINNRLWAMNYRRNLHAKFVFVYTGMTVGLGIVNFIISRIIVGCI